MEELDSISEAICNDLRERGYRDNIPIEPLVSGYLLDKHINDFATPATFRWAVATCMCSSGKLVDGGRTGNGNVYWLSGEQL
jgi:hypothetical protein